MDPSTAILLSSLFSGLFGGLFGGGGNQELQSFDVEGGISPINLLRMGIDQTQGLLAEGQLLADEPVNLRSSYVQQPPVFCLTLPQRLLTADLRWVPSGDIKAGDNVLAFDAKPHSTNNRQWKPALVTMAHPTTTKCVRVFLSDGSFVDCTVDHPWLAEPDVPCGVSKRSWIRADKLMHQRTGANGRNVVRAFDPWRDAGTFEEGWLAGLFDGEGYVGSCTNGGIRLSVMQKPGAVLDKAVTILKRLGTTVRVDKHESGVCEVSILGGFKTIVPTLGSLRPTRLLSNLSKLLEGRRVHATNRVKVVAVEPIGRHDIQAISTTAQTYVGEGFLMHNTGGGLPMPIGVKGVDPALANPDLLSLHGFNFSGTGSAAPSTAPSTARRRTTPGSQDDSQQALTALRFLL